MKNNQFLQDKSAELLLEVTKILIQGDSQKKITSCIQDTLNKKTLTPNTPIQKVAYWQKKRKATRNLIADSLLSTCLREEDKLEISELSKLYMQSFDLMTRIGSEIILLTKKNTYN